jgi:hypothetical protein
VLPTRNHQQGNKVNASPAPVSANQALFPDIELNNGIAEKGSSDISFSNSDPLAPRKRFRLFNGEFTTPVVVQEKTEMILFASLPQLGAVAAMLPLDVIYFSHKKILASTAFRNKFINAFLCLCFISFRSHVMVFLCWFLTMEERWL